MDHHNQDNKQKNKNIRISKSSVLLIVMFIAGLLLLIYPSFSNAWNTAHSSHLVASYDSSVRKLSKSNTQELLQKAEDYNKSLLSNPSRYQMTDEERTEYEGLLDPDGTGVMGIISIPDIDVELPIYHGTDNAVLTIGAGHLEGSSLPVGGTGTHAVITGHRGLPRAKLFTDLPKLSEGSIFQITVLNKTLTYEVDQILTVLPDEVESLEIDPTQDYVTLAQALPTAKTIEQVKYGDGVSDVRASVVSYALQFVGNRYVWGGTSLENGVDCSGFTMRILGKYGVSLPHSSKAQPSYGTKISASDAKPGDLFFYGSGSSISHVAIYIGNGQIVHASNKRDGIKVSNAFYRSPICVARYLPD